MTVDLDVARRLARWLARTPLPGSTAPSEAADTIRALVDEIECTAKRYGYALGVARAARVHLRRTNAHACPLCGYYGNDPDTRDHKADCPAKRLALALVELEMEMDEERTTQDHRMDYQDAHGKLWTQLERLREKARAAVSQIPEARKERGELRKDYELRVGMLAAKAQDLRAELEADDE